MSGIESLRRVLDRFYNMRLMNALGAVLVVLAAKRILATCYLDNSMSWAVAAIIGLVFFISPLFGVIFTGIAVFASLMHISGLMSLVLLALMLLLAVHSHQPSWAAIVMPMAFLPESPLLSLGFSVLFFGLCMYAKYENSWRVALFPVLWAAWDLFTCSHGIPNYIYKEDFNYRVPETTIEDALEHFNPLNGYQNIMERGMQNFLIILGLFLALGFLYYLLSIKVRLVRTLNEDVRDAVNFIVMIAATIGVYFAIVRLCKTGASVPFVQIILGGVVGYLVSRPWAGSVAIDLEHNADDKNQAAKLAAVASSDTWDSLAGYDETKREIQEVIKPYVDKRELAKLVKANMKPVKGILLYGPPGTGKTTMARIIANETKMNLILVNASQFMSKWVGESERNLANIFKQAKAKAPTIICFEEIEAFLRKRTETERNYETSIINVFLAEMDGFTSLKNVLIVATTNNPEMIDEAAMRPGRFDKIIYMGAPDPAGRRALFDKYLKGKADLNTIDIDKLVGATERFTGADIKAVCEAAYRDNDFNKLSEEDILAVIAQTLPSYTLDMQDRYELYSKKFARNTSAQNDNKGKETRKLTWDDIKGMDATKALLKDKIESPIVNAEKYKQYGIPASKGILLFGPPGCGKTFFAKVAADESNANFFVVNGPELLGAGTGESEANLRRKFRDARETKPSIIFFDEIDAIAGKRSGNAGSVRIINQLLTEIDGMDSLDGVMVIAATNRPETLDEALMRSGRFDTKIYIPLPDKASIKALLESTMQPVPFIFDLDLAAQKLDGYTCADIVAIANKAKEQFVKRQIIKGEDAAEPVSDEELLGIIERVKSSVSPEDRARYESLKQFESIL